MALRLAEHGYKIDLLAKGDFQDSATYWAQGGIAVPFGADDSIEQHIADTIKVGAGLCDRETVKHVVSNAESAMQELIDMGLSPTSNAEGYELGKEGGHSNRRIVHVGDSTGKVLTETLKKNLSGHPNIRVHSFCFAVDLIQQDNSCVGAYVLDVKRGKVLTFNSKFTVLAAGGASWVYLYSTNPQSATGDGVAMAARAGCRIANMEFMQFHPTCLYHPVEKSFLLSETLRGEGAKLLLPSGEKFMHKFSKQAELAPRDVVARAIDSVMKRNGLDFVYLDISHKPAKFIKERFPTIYKKCLSLGFDITKQPVPVIPAAHYTCGGVLTNKRGLSDLDNLYALGETACSGLHGANRLASNSLLECLVMARTVAQDIHGQFDKVATPPASPSWDESQLVDSDEDVIISHNWDELRRFMWNYVGIVRTSKRLQRALSRVLLLKEEVREYYRSHYISRDFLELRNLITCAELIIRSALKRRESRGLHYNLDYPASKTSKTSQTRPRNTVLSTDWL